MFLFLSIILSAVFTGENERSGLNTLNGEWVLVQTELYKNGELVGETRPDKLTTHYHFSLCSESDLNCQLIISEDGEKQVYNYCHEVSEGLLILDETNSYTIEKITPDELVLYKDYDPHRSRYSFRKVA